MLQVLEADVQVICLFRDHVQLISGLGLMWFVGMISFHYLDKLR